MLVDVGDSDLGELPAQLRDELGRGQAAAAEIEEVVLRARHYGAEDLEPELPEPGRGAGEIHRSRGRGQGRQRPRKSIAIDLARGPGRQGVDLGEAGYERRRHGRSKLFERRVEVEALIGGDVSDQDRVARIGAADRCGGSGDSRQPEQGAVDLAELYPPAAELDLLIGPAQEDQPFELITYDVAAAIGP